jgi:hypothetical protein
VQHAGPCGGGGFARGRTTAASRRDGAPPVLQPPAAARVLRGGRRPRARRSRGSASPFYGDAGLKILARTPSRGPAAAAAMACLSRWAMAGLAAGPARAG